MNKRPDARRAAVAALGEVLDDHRSLGEVTAFDRLDDAREAAFAVDLAPEDAELGARALERGEQRGALRRRVLRRAPDGDDAVEDGAHARGALLAEAHQQRREREVRTLPPSAPSAASSIVNGATTSASR